MKIHSFFDVPVGHVGHFTTVRTFFLLRALTLEPPFRSGLREGVRLKNGPARDACSSVDTVIFLE
jgi:hypothetical protein